MENRFEEKTNYIKIKLDEIEKAFKCTKNHNEFGFKWYETTFNFNIIAEIEIIGIRRNLFYFHPDDNVKSIDKKLKQICNIIL